LAIPLRYARGTGTDVVGSYGSGYFGFEDTGLVWLGFHYIKNPGVKISSESLWLDFTQSIIPQNTVLAAFWLVSFLHELGLPSLLSSGGVCTTRLFTSGNKAFQINKRTRRILHD
jgi:hypothetical protein